jgi:hypothetical protein
MIQFKYLKIGCPFWLSIGKRVITSAEAYKLPYAANGCFMELILSVAAP